MTTLFVTMLHETHLLFLLSLPLFCSNLMLKLLWLVCNLLIFETASRGSQSTLPPKFEQHGGVVETIINDLQTSESKTGVKFEHAYLLQLPLYKTYGFIGSKSRAERPSASLSRGAGANDRREWASLGARA